MTGLSDPVPILGHHGGYAAGAALFSGRQIVLALLVIAAVSVILWIPVFSDQMMDFLSRTAPRYAPLTFLAGLGLLVIGLVAGVRILDIIGASMIGALALGFLVENY
ncbi:MAG TPA: hypothetical protein VF940_28770 [Streptosporangiaceae bacterium]